MSKKTKQTSKPTSGFISRTRIIVTAISLLILSGGFTVYALSTHHAKLVTPTDTPTVQTSESDKSSGTSTTSITAATDTTPTSTKTTPSKTTPSTTPTPTTPAPSEVVTPSPSIDVPALTPPETGSNSTASYQSTNWAGYLSTGGSFTAVTGTWIAPSPIGTSTTVESGDGTWIGKIGRAHV